MLVILWIYFCSTKASLFWISSYSYWSVLLYPVFEVQSTPSAALHPSVQSSAKPPFCEMMQLECLPVSCNHFSGSLKSKDRMYWIWTKGRWKRLRKVQVIFSVFSMREEDIVNRLMYCTTMISSKKGRGNYSRKLINMYKAPINVLCLYDWCKLKTCWAKIFRNKGKRTGRSVAILINNKRIICLFFVVHKAITCCSDWLNASALLWLLISL